MVRRRTWQPTEATAHEHYRIAAETWWGQPTSSWGRRSRGSCWNGNACEATSWRTDTEISAEMANGAGKWEHQPRELQMWENPSDGTGCSNQVPLGTLEELAASSCAKDYSYNQFEVNREAFGVVSTFKEDLSQYTTKLDVALVPTEIRVWADQIANEIEMSGQAMCEDDDGCTSDEDVGEEELFAACPRNRNCSRNARCPIKRRQWRQRRRCLP